MNLLQRFFDTNDDYETETVETEKECTITHSYQTWNYEVELVDKTVKLYGGNIVLQDGGVVFEQPEPYGRHVSLHDHSQYTHCDVRENWIRQQFFSYENLISFKRLRENENKFKNTEEYIEVIEQTVDEDGEVIESEFTGVKNKPMMNEHQIRERQKELLDEYYRLHNTDPRKYTTMVQYNLLQEILGKQEHRIKGGDNE